MCSAETQLCAPPSSWSCTLIVWMRILFVLLMVSAFHSRLFVSSIQTVPLGSSQKLTTILPSIRIAYVQNLHLFFPCSAHLTQFVLFFFFSLLRPQMDCNYFLQICIQVNTLALYYPLIKIFSEVYLCNQLSICSLRRLHACTGHIKLPPTNFISLRICRQIKMKLFHIKNACKRP